MLMVLSLLQGKWLMNNNDLIRRNSFIVLKQYMTFYGNNEMQSYV